MCEVRFPSLIRLRADDELAHDLVEAARWDKLSSSEFAGRELRKAVARTPVSVGRADDDGPGPGGTAPACARRLMDLALIDDGAALAVQPTCALALPVEGHSRANASPTH